MRFTHRFEVAASLETVATFHRASSSMAAITPPPVIARVHSAPEHLAEGDEMLFTLWFGPLPIRWRAGFESVGPNGFIDRMLDGPFDEWVHEHHFERIDHSRTIIKDIVDYSFSRHPVWSIVGRAMAAGLPTLFAYRGWRTRSLLEAGSRARE